MAVVEDNDPFVVEEESGRLILVVEEESHIVEAPLTETVQVNVPEVSIIEETPDPGFIIEQGDEDPLIIVLQQDAVDLESCEQGPPGPPGPTGPAGAAGEELTPVTISSTGVQTIDTVDSTGRVAVEWTLAGITAEGARRGAKVYATWDASGDTWRTVYARNGGGFAAFGIGVTMSGSDILLEVTNNHTSNLTMHGIRLDVP